MKLLKFLILLILFSLVGFETYQLFRLTKEKDFLKSEISKLNVQLAENEKQWEEKWGKRFHEICGSPFDKCNFIPTSRNSFVGLHTSRGKETTYSLSLPDTWEINAYSGYGLQVHFAQKNSGGRNLSTIYSKGQFSEKEGQVYCIADPSRVTGISPELKRLFEKYKNIKTEFGVFKLSWTSDKVNTNEFNLCQAKQEGYPDWITDTLIGHILLVVDETDYVELEKVIRSITSAKLHQTVYQ